MNILQLAPLIRRLREKVEADSIPLEESVRTLSYASELVLFKLRWLLPNPQDEVEEAEEETVVDEAELAAATQSVLMEPWEVEGAYSAVSEALKRSSAKFTRGHVASYKDVRRVVVNSIDPGDLRKAFLSAKLRTDPTHRGIVLPRWSFVAHLRGFWREVRRLASRGGVLTFSRFLGQSRMDAILNFLAFLELIKRRRLFAWQRTLFGEIVFSPEKDKLQEEVEGNE